MFKYKDLINLFLDYLFHWRYNEYVNKYSHKGGIMHTKVDMGELSLFFKVFSDETRLKILGTLLDSDKCVCEIADIIGVSSSAVSHQLKLLRALNLVKTNKCGQNVTYGVSDEHIKFILEYGIEHINER